jgi:hypothetical protein
MSDPLDISAAFTTPAANEGIEVDVFGLDRKTKLGSINVLGAVSDEFQAAMW